MNTFNHATAHKPSLLHVARTCQHLLPQVVVRRGSFIRGNARLFLSLGGRDYLNNQVSHVHTAKSQITIVGVHDTSKGTSAAGSFGCGRDCRCCCHCNARCHGESGIFHRRQRLALTSHSSFNNFLIRAQDCNGLAMMARHAASTAHAHPMVPAPTTCAPATWDGLGLIAKFQNRAPTPAVARARAVQAYVHATQDITVVAVRFPFAPRTRSSTLHLALYVIAQPTARSPKCV
jgi:hypothetical protein